jgi:hypothetical protein
MAINDVSAGCLLNTCSHDAITRARQKQKCHLSWLPEHGAELLGPGADGILDALEKLSDQADAHGQLESTGHAT